MSPRKQVPLSIGLDGGQDSYTHGLRVQPPSMRRSRNTRFTEVPGTVVGRPTEEALDQESTAAPLKFIARRSNQVVGLHTGKPAAHGNLSLYSDARSEFVDSEERAHIQPYRVTGSRVPPLPNDYEVFVPSSHRRTITIDGESRTLTCYVWATSILAQALAGAALEEVYVRVVDEDGMVLYRDSFTRSGSVVDASRYGLFVLPVSGDADADVGWRIFWTETVGGVRNIMSRAVRFPAGVGSLDTVQTVASSLTHTGWHACVSSEVDTAFWVVYSASGSVRLARFLDSGTITSAGAVEAGILVGIPAVRATNDEVCVLWQTTADRMRAAVYDDDAGVGNNKAPANVMFSASSIATGHTYVRATIADNNDATETWILAAEHVNFGLGRDTYGDDARYGVVMSPYGTGSSITTTDIPNALLYGHAAPSQVLLYFGGLNGDDPTDQTVVGMELDDSRRPWPVYRLGTDILEGAFNALGSGLWLEAWRNAGRDVVGNELRICYHQRTEFAGSGYPAQRESFVDLAPTYLPVTTRNDVLSLATAWPRDVDGYMALESGAVAAPQVRAEAVSGGAWTNGTYAITAVLVITDAQGSVRRSPPSLPFEVTTSGQSVNAEVSIIWQHRTGVDPVGNVSELEVEIYASLAGGPALLVSQSPVPLDDSSVYGYWQCTNLAQYQTATIPLYTEGGVFAAGVVPAMHAIKTVRDRDWCIPSELREYVYYSKPYEFEVTTEWTPSQNIYVPGGDNIALAEMRGLPIIFKSRSIYVVYGDGPGASGAGQQFGLPVEVAEIGCADEATVVSAPGGVYFLSSRGMIERLLPDMSTVEPVGLPVRGQTAAGTFVGAVHVGDEILWLSGSSSDTSLVFNTVAGRWSEWDVYGSSIIEGPDGNVWIVQDDTPYALRANGSTSPMVLETPWLQLGGEHGSGAIDELWLLIERFGAHSLSIELRYDYDESTAQTVTVSDADITTDRGGAEARYTVVTRPSTVKARAVKAIITQTSGNSDAMRPLSATVHWAADAGGLARAIGATLRK